ncbi:type II toxin-antitoxin system VapC family toxin [uncultured Methanobrevibacter sp.]|uniref:type II toxin-antitoxin system VapC family toxin n=1 Tax=uncultured Methanobrevibacter sp. TaxID=253161 RepID=UPI0025D90971|nr:type II toxin-antitoxin system VapC family toxin [uncultured Methanobrevibacter sp.]
MLFIDSSYIIALMNKKAKKHKEAKQINELIKKEYTTINSTVLIEILNNLTKKRYELLRDDIINILYNMNKIVYLTPKDYDKALHICKDYNFAINYSDCTILKTMIDYNINTIVSFNRDFDKIKEINRFYL